MGEIEHAKKEYEKAIQLNNEYADAYNNLGYLYLFISTFYLVYIVPF